MDIQASQSNNVHNILTVEGVQTTSDHKNIYIPATTHSQTNPQQNQQHVILQSNQDHTVGSIANVQQQSQSAPNILHGDTTIPLRNIKVDPETLTQPGPSLIKTALCGLEISVTWELGKAPLILTNSRSRQPFH